jgi:hypothetical protein
MKEINIIDQPNDPSIEGQPDALGLENHSEALVEFIKRTNTPITMGIQGSWGSGKTSLLNSIKHKLDPNSDNKGEFYQIWINTWEQSLMMTPEESLIKILSSIINDLIKADTSEENRDKFKKGIKTGLSSLVRLSANVVGGDKASSIVEELIGEENNTIKEIREQLKTISKTIRERTTNPINKIVIYVDDLDRIEPKNAVSILELLKNIFDVEGCVFVLAIDYEVVVKGLEHKFGKRTEENDWEFRAFFDKIIQLPFMMPLGKYTIADYVNKLLKSIEFIESDLDDEIIQIILENTIGSNPRALKRLVNSLALIDILTRVESKNRTEESEDNQEDKTLLFSMVCLQIQYPKIFELLSHKPDFTKWDDKFSFAETKGKETNLAEFEKDFENAKNIEDSNDKLFDEDWEQALFKICYLNPRLKGKIFNISKLLNFIREKNFSSKADKENMAERLSAIIEQTAVTSVTISDSVETKKPAKRDYGKPVIDLLADFANTLDENTEYELKLIRDEFSKYVLGIAGVEIKNNTRNAHISLATVNEKSRIHHNIKRKDFDRKNLFFYSDIESKNVVKLFSKSTNGKVLVYFKGSDGSLESINAEEIS